MKAALFYPRMHVEDVAWLKASLLLFDEVHRMVPMHLEPEDSDGIRPFAQPQGGGRILLRPADIYSQRVQLAQASLAKKLRKDAHAIDLRRMFGEEATRKRRGPRSLGFQIYASKMTRDLSETLLRYGLAWSPALPEPYPYYEGYVEVHPRIGEAVMSTLAVACAKGGGLSILTDDRSEPLHECLLRLDAKLIYDAWVKGKDGTGDMPEPHQTTPDNLFECLVTIACDTKALDAEKLAQMKKNREPLQALVANLKDRAARFQAMDPGDRRDDYLESEVADILKTWERDRANMDGFWKRFFGFGLIDPTAKTAGQFVDKMIAAAGPATTVGAPAAAGLVTTGNILGAGAGLVIGLLAHGGKTLSETIRAKKTSPYRYLTIMREQGVLFRSSSDIKARSRAVKKEVAS